MGGKGSGQYPGNANWAGGKSKKTAISVVGSGVPEIPDWLPDAAYPYWHIIVERTSGVAFSQDSDAIGEMASLTWRQHKLNDALAENPTDDDLNRVSLAVGRQLRSLWEGFGLTPRSRQVLVVPSDEEPELDELERLQQGFQ